MTRGRQREGLLPATDSAPHPASYAVGSPASRAAARALIGTKIDMAKRLDFVVRVVGHREKFNPPRVGKWKSGPDGSLSRISYIPWGMSLQEAESVVRDGR